MSANLLQDYPIYKQHGYSADQLNAIPYLLIVIAFSFIIFAVEFWLDIRQLNLFRVSKSIPKELNDLKDSIDKDLFETIEDSFHKSTAYGRDKFSFGLIESLFTFVIGIGLILFGYLPYMWDLSESVGLKFNVISGKRDTHYEEMVVTSLFIILMTIQDNILTLPFSLYKTFVVEQKHGFNKSTIGLFFRDKLMTLALTVGFGCPVMSAVVWVVRWGGEHFYFYVWLFLFIVSLIMMTVYPTLIAPLFNKYERLDSGEVFDAVAALAKRVEFPLTQLFVIDGSKRSAHSNAYFYGFFKVIRSIHSLPLPLHRVFTYLAEQANRAVRHAAEAGGDAGAAGHLGP